MKTEYPLQNGDNDSLVGIISNQPFEKVIIFLLLVCVGNSDKNKWREKNLDEIKKRLKKKESKEWILKEFMLKSEDPW
jgi:hypothetical protein